MSNNKKQLIIKMTPGLLEAVIEQITELRDTTYSIKTQMEAEKNIRRLRRKIHKRLGLWRKGYQFQRVADVE